MPVGERSQSTSESFETAGVSTSGEEPSGEDLSFLYRAHAPWLARRLKALVGEGAEDAVQEAYCRLAKYPIGTVFRHPRALLLKIARNLAYEAARRRRGVVVISMADEEGYEHDQPVEADQAAQLILKELIMALPETYRQTFILSRFAGLTNKEIARQLGVSVKGVEWRMSQALAICVTQLKD